MPKGSTAYVVYKATGMDAWRVSKITITYLSDEASTAMPWTDAGLPMPEIAITGEHKTLIKEPTARDVALR